MTGTPLDSAINDTVQSPHYAWYSVLRTASRPAPISRCRNVAPLRFTMISRVQLWLHIAALTSIASGLIGGAVWLVDLVDRSDGDDLRWGFWHNPFMGFTPFSEPYLEISMWILLGCSFAIGVGGLMLLARITWGAYLVCWQAPVSIITNSIVVGAIAMMAFGALEMHWWKIDALALRLGSIMVNLMLWRFLKSSAVTRHLEGHQSR